MIVRTKHTRRLASLAAAGLVAALNAVPQAALGSPITFATGDYDNTANVVNSGPTPVNNQTTGLFRDEFWYSINNGAPRVGSPDFINQGNSLVLQNNHAVPGSGPYTALNVTGPSVSGGNTYMAIYDKTVGDGVATRSLFDASGSQHLLFSTDVLFVKHNSSAGLVALYSRGQDGLALLANNGDGNNPDKPSVSLVYRANGADQILTSTSLAASSFTAASWYRVAMDLSVTGNAWSVTGSFFDHVDATNPNSALGGLITTLLFTGSMLDPDGGAANQLLVLTNPGEIGLVAMGNESISLPDNVGVSFTNFDIHSTCVNCTQEQEVPEPGSLALLASGLGLLGVVANRRQRRRNA